MNKYLIPICDDDEVFIWTINASSLSDAEEKLMTQIADEYGIEETLTFQEFEGKCWDNNIVIGKFYDIDEF